MKIYPKLKSTHSSACYIYELMPRTGENSKKAEILSNCYRYEISKSDHELEKFVDYFFEKICGMFLTEKGTNQIVDLCISMLQTILQTCDLLLEKNSSNNFQDIIIVANNKYVIKKLKQNHSVHLRKKHVEQNDLFVPPTHK